MSNFNKILKGTETHQESLKEFAVHFETQKHLNQQIENQYEKLSHIEREKIAEWIKSHLSTMPMPNQTKRFGLAKLLDGDYQYFSTLSMIRYAMVALHLL